MTGRSFRRGLTAILAVALLTTLAWSLLERQRLERRVAALTADMAQREDILRQLSDPQSRAVHMPGLPASPRATGLLLWNPVTRTGVLMAMGLSQASPEKAYALWAMAGAEQVPAGAFTVDQTGRAVLWLTSLPQGKEFDRFSVTLEPAGGASRPSGPMHLLGSL